MERSPSPPASVRHAVTALGGLIVAACGAVVFRGALDTFFAADDFPALARAQGLLPRLAGPWRLLSGQIFFDVMHPLAGLDPRGYHAAGLLLHAACAVTLYLLLRRRLSTPAALAGAACFATHPSHFTATYWVSGIGAPLAMLGALGAIHTARRRGAVRWLAVPLFAAALLSRESVVLLPVVIAAFLRWDAGEEGEQRPRVWRDPLVVALGVIAIAQVVHFAAADVVGARSGSIAYRPDFGRALWANLFSYLGWTANFLLPTTRSFQDAPDPLVYAWGAVLLALWLAGASSAALRWRGWIVAGILHLALLLPVLPLGRHTYHYYLYGALAGFAWCIAAALDVVFRRIARPRARPARTGAAPPAPSDRVADLDLRAWAPALLVTVLVTVNGMLLVRKIATAPLADAVGLYSDATVDRSSIARNAIESLRSAGVPARTRLLFWSPIGRAWAGGSTGESYFETNVRAALFDGLAVRVFFPAVDSARFVTTYRSLPDPYRYAVYRPDGRLRVASSATLDSLLAAGPPKP